VRLEREAASFTKNLSQCRFINRTGVQNETNPIILIIQILHRSRGRILISCRDRTTRLGTGKLRQFLHRSGRRLHIEDRSEMRRILQQSNRRKPTVEQSQLDLHWTGLEPPWQHCSRRYLDQDHPHQRKRRQHRHSQRRWLGRRQHRAHRACPRNQDIVSEQQVTANGNGVISASVTIPSSAVSGEKWVVKGFIPGVGANATSNQFTVGASSQDIQLFISPVFGPAGSSVTVTGSNWPANAVVRLGPARPNSDIVSEVQATANASGSFNTKVTIPSNAANGETWVVKAFIPGSGHQKTSNNFTVSSSTSNNSYTVVRGDTLRSIARKFNVTYADLLAANPQISNPNLIFTGQKINLPAGASSDAVYHTVVKGDTLKKIAAAYGTTWDAVYALNSKLIRNPNIIYPGQVLRVK
jgi:LysM repeat protein